MGSDNELFHSIRACEGSMSEDAVDRLIVASARLTELKIKALYMRARGTPIERMMFVAIQMLSELTQDRMQLVISHGDPELDDIQPNQVWLWREKQVAGWRVDILLGAVDAQGRRHFVIVECDGHAFHERTKEQAARDRFRDREAQALGYRILRYTGSEIWENAFDAAADAVIAITRLTKGR